jgi:epoxyqueuosine reductase
VLIISSKLNELEIDNQPIKATIDEHELTGKNLENYSYHTSHKMIATRAGIGWIGKTDLLISLKFGPRIRLASILTNFQFSRLGIPINESRCGECNICVIKCPANAANGKLWDIHIDRDQFYNPLKCRNKCRELSKERINKRLVFVAYVFLYALRVIKLTHNRVRAGFSPALPTPPDMRVRIRRFITDHFG